MDVAIRVWREDGAAGLFAGAQAAVSITAFVDAMFFGFATGFILFTEALSVTFSAPMPFALTF